LKTHIKEISSNEISSSPSELCLVEKLCLVSVAREVRHANQAKFLWWTIRDLLFNKTPVFTWRG
jgi:hypothetical protein